MTPAAPPLQLALALDEQPKRTRKVGFVIPPRPFVTVTHPYDEADRARLVRAINRLQWGDSLHSHPYRLERHPADRDENGDEHDEFYILTRNSDPVWKRVISAEKDDTLQKCFHDAVEAMSIDLCERGVTDWFPRPGEVRYCGHGIGVARLESKTDCAESLCETVSENIGYNYTDDGVFRQEALVAVPIRIDVSVYGYDDDEVTLRDGTISVIQEGSPFKVSGSRSFVRDPRLSRLNPAQTSRAIRQAARIGLPLMSAPAHLKWCSEHETPKHVDQRLLVTDPVAYWAQRGFVPRYQFGDSPKVNGKPKYKDGKLPVCKECRARHERMMYAAFKEQQGQPVRPYNRRTSARPVASARRSIA